MTTLRWGVREDQLVQIEVSVKNKSNVGIPRGHQKLWGLGISYRPKRCLNMMLRYIYATISVTIFGKVKEAMASKGA